MSIRNVGTAALFAFVLAATVSCTAADHEAHTGGNDPDPTAAAAELYQERANAILRYVEAERMQIPKIQAVFPGVYSEVRAEATMEEQRGDRGIPAGTYAVAHFHYTYSNNTDWSSTIAGLDPRSWTRCRFGYAASARVADLAAA